MKEYEIKTVNLTHGRTGYTVREIISKQVIGGKSYITCTVPTNGKTYKTEARAIEVMDDMKTTNI